MMKTFISCAAPSGKLFIMLDKGSILTEVNLVCMNYLKPATPPEPLPARFISMLLAIESRCTALKKNPSRFWWGLLGAQIMPYNRGYFE